MLFWIVPTLFLLFCFGLLGCLYRLLLVIRLRLWRRFFLNWLGLNWLGFGNCYILLTFFYFSCCTNFSWLLIWYFLRFADLFDICCTLSLLIIIRLDGGYWVLHWLFGCLCCGLLSLHLLNDWFDILNSWLWGIVVSVLLDLLRLFHFFWLWAFLFCLLWLGRQLNFHFWREFRLCWWICLSFFLLLLYFHFDLLLYLNRIGLLLWLWDFRLANIFWNCFESRPIAWTLTQIDWLELCINHNDFGLFRWGFICRRGNSSFAGRPILGIFLFWRNVGNLNFFPICWRMLELWVGLQLFNIALLRQNVESVLFVDKLGEALKALQLIRHGAFQIVVACELFVLHRKHCRLDMLEEFLRISFFLGNHKQGSATRQ